MAGVQAGRLSIDIVAEVARLQADMDKVRKLVRDASGDIAKSARAANDNLAGIGDGITRAGNSSRLASHHVQNLAFQFQDLGVQIASGANPLTAFMQQGGQIAGIMGQAGIGVRGLAMEMLALAAPFAPLIAGVAAVALGVGLLTAEVNKNSAIQVTWKDVVLGAWDAARDYLSSKLTAAFEYFGTTAGDVWQYVVDATKTAVNFMIGATSLSIRMIVAGFQTLPAAIGDAFYSGVNLGIRAINGLVQKAVAAVNAFAELVNPMLEKVGLSIPKLGAPQISELENSYAGAGARAASAFSRAITDTWNRDFIGEAAAFISPYAQARARSAGEEAAAEAGRAAGRAHGAAAGQAARDTFAEELAKGFGNSMDSLQAGAVRRSEDYNRTANEGWSAIVSSPEADAAYQATVRLNEAMQQLRDTVGQIDLGAVFGNAGDAIMGMQDALDRLTAAQQAHGVAVDAAGKKTEAIAKANAEYDKAKLNGTVALLGQTKRLFAEQSTGYKMVAAAEKAAAAITAVNTVKDVAAGAAKIFSRIPAPWAFPIVAGMLGVMASLGFSGGSSSQVAPPSAEDLQAQAGTGSVLGDASAQSASIANSLKLMAENSNADLEYSNAMLKALRAIDGNIAAMANTVAKQISVSGSMFDTSGLSLGSSGSGGFLGIGASSTTRNLYDLGLQLNSGTLSELLTNGIDGKTYQTVQQIKKSSGFFGIGGGTSTRYQTTYGQIDAGITQAITDVLASLRTGLIEAAGVIGLDGAAAIIDGFQVSLGKISFSGMTGEEIESQLNAIFSKVGDDIAGALLPSLKSMQQVGEGLFETFMRVTRQYQVVDTALKSIGMAFGEMGVSSLAARDALVQLFGSMDEFAERTAYFRQNFLSVAEQMAPVQQSVADELARLGLSSVDTIDEFKAVVLGLDLTTAAGREMYAALMALAPAFKKVEDYEKSLADQQKTLLDQQTKALTDAYKRQRSELEQTADKFRGFANDLRRFRDSLFMDSASSNAARWSQLVNTGNMAALGNEASLQALPGVASSYLSSARGSAGSLADYQREVARVVGIVDRAIGGANGMATAAEQQIKALEDQVEGLIAVNDSVVSVEEAVERLHASMGVQSDAQAEAMAEQRQMQAALVEEIQKLRRDAEVRDTRIIELAARADTFWRRTEVDGLYVRGASSNEPVKVKTV